jgi:hypothetical protein
VREIELKNKALVVYENKLIHFVINQKIPMLVREPSETIITGVSKVGGMLALLKILHVTLFVYHRMRHEVRLEILTEGNPSKVEKPESI